MSDEKKSPVTQIFIGVATTVLAAVILNWITLCGKEPKVSGAYSGSAFNTITGRSGNVHIVLNQDTSGKITGTANITGDLLGSGPLEGHVSGNRIGFTSVEQSTNVLITWEGNIQGSEITGHYTVSVPPALKAQGFIDQEGVWKVSK
jgi:hypothetical protein